jgi:hypothetical protein
MTLDTPLSIPYNVTINLTLSYVNQITPAGPLGPSTGVSVLCSPAKLNLTNNGGSEVTGLASCKVTATQIGNYTVTVLGVAGTLGTPTSITHALTFPVQVLGPDFTVVPSTTVQPVSVGASAMVGLTINGNLGLYSNVTLSFQSPSAGLSFAINPPYVTVSSAKPAATANITITAGPSAATGTYSLTLTAFATSIKITHTITVTLVVTTTTSPHDLGIYSVSATPTSTTVGSLVTITIVAQNLGKSPENSTVIAIAGDVSVGQKNITIAPGTNMTIVLTWNTAGYNTGAYMIGGKILAIPGETIYSNNLLRSATPVTLTAANTSVLQSPYFQPGIIAALVAIIGIVAILFLRQTRRKMPQSANQ